MSDTTDGLDIRAQIASIDRALADAAKLREESNKLAHEAHKLAAEAAKLNPDRLLAPLIVAAVLLGGLGGLVTFSQWVAQLAH